MRKLSRTFAAIVGVATMVVGSVAISSAPVAFAAGGTITGVVRDSQGAPIPNATVRAMRDETGYLGPPVTVVADGSGSFTIGNLAPAVYRLGAVATGYAARYANADDWMHATTFTITGAETLSGGITLFHPTATISGRIVDDHGTPVAGASVLVGLAYWPMGMNTLVTYDHFGQMVTTGADGRYTASGLASGAFHMSVTSPSETLIGGVYPTLQGPGASFPVAEGATVTDIDLTLVHSGSVTGRVTNSSGQPVAGAHVVVGGWDTPHQATSAADGTYTITGVEPGPQWVLAQLYPSSYLTTYYGQVTYAPEAGSFSVPAAGTISGIDIELIDGIAVLVHLPDGTLPTSSFRYIRGCRSPGVPVPAPQAANPQLDCSNDRPVGEVNTPNASGDVLVRFPVGDYQLQAIFADYRTTGTTSLRVSAGSAPECTLRITGESSCTTPIPAPPVVTPPEVTGPPVIAAIGLDLTPAAPYVAAQRIPIAG